MLNDFQYFIGFLIGCACFAVIDWASPRRLFMAIDFLKTADFGGNIVKRTRFIPLHRAALIVATNAALVGLARGMGDGFLGLIASLLGAAYFAVLMFDFAWSARAEIREGRATWEWHPYKSSRKPHQDQDSI